VPKLDKPTEQNQIFITIITISATTGFPNKFFPKGVIGDLFWQSIFAFYWIAGEAGAGGGPGLII